jgi:hypothetical protein
MAVFRGVQNVTSKQEDQPSGLSGDDRSAGVPQQRDASSRPQTPVQPVS